jgi:Zinc-finger associated domain (zf-AD)
MDDEMNFNLICRICLQREGAMKSVFALDPSREMKLFEKIEKCSTLKVSENCISPNKII